MDDEQKRKPPAPPGKPEAFADGDAPDAEDYSVGKIMNRHPIVFPETATVLDVCETMAENRGGQVVVVGKDWKPRSRLEAPPEPLGIFTERDLIRAFATHREKVLGMTVGEVMTTPVVTIGEDEDIEHAANLMMLMRIRRIPVVKRGRTVGVLTRGRVMEAQAGRLAEVRKENKALEERVVHDPLTGLANRVLFEEVLRREVGRARTRGGTVSLLMLDLDHFKKVNDNYGHPVGDIVLRQFANTLRNSLRRADLPARVGGEEFAVVLVQSEAEPVLVAEKIRKAVADEAYGEQGDSFRMTVSIGCATWHEGLGDVETLIKKADEVLYEAKHSGRNRVASA